MQMIEYMYTGNVKQATDLLLIAAVKKLCELHLIETIDMQNVVSLLVLAEQYNAEVLFNKVLMYVRENYAAFMKLEDAKSIILMYPDVAFKLFSQIM